MVVAVQWYMCIASNVNLNLSITAVHVALCNIQTSQPNRLTHTNQLYVVWLPIVCMVPVLMHWIYNTRHAQHVQQRMVICEIMITWWLVTFVPCSCCLAQERLNMLVFLRVRIVVWGVWTTQRFCNFPKIIPIALLGNSPTKVSTLVYA